MINNPMLHKELLLRFRIRHSRSAQIGFAVLAALVIGMFYYFSLRALLINSGSAIGHDIWGMAIALQYLIVCVLAPSLTANCITQEREQQTWEMLLFTRLSPAEIIYGKLAARLVSAAILLAVFLPITLLSWAHANSVGSDSSVYISVGQFCLAYTVIIVSTVFYATFALFLSLRMKRTLYAIIGSYVFVIGVLCVGTLMVTSLLSYGVSGTGSEDFFNRSPFLWFNPVRLMIAVFATREPSSPLTLVCGILGYMAATVFMLAYMIVAFRRLAQD